MTLAQITTTVAVGVVNASSSGMLELYTMVGQLVSACQVNRGKMEISLPVNHASGIYTGIFTPNDGGMQNKVRLVYQP